MRTSRSCMIVPAMIDIGEVKALLTLGMKLGALIRENLGEHAAWFEVNRACRTLRDVLEVAMALDPVRRNEEAERVLSALGN